MFEDNLLGNGLNGLNGDDREEKPVLLNEDDEDREYLSLIEKANKYLKVINLNFGFSRSPSTEGAKRQFMNFLAPSGSAGSSNEWFGYLLYFLLQKRKEFRVTEIFLVEGKPIMIARPLVHLHPSLQIETDGIKRKIPIIPKGKDLLNLASLFLKMNVTHTFNCANFFDISSLSGISMS